MSSRTLAATGLVTATLLATACSPQSFVVRRIADQLAAQGDAPEDDLLLARDAAPFYLKLAESVLREDPGHLKLAEAVAAGFTRYAYAFVAMEADKLEAHDAGASGRLRARAAALYLRAQRHALAALGRRHPGLLATLASDRPFELAHDEVGLAYWGAAAWGASIALSKDRPEAVADLPIAVRLATAAWRRNPDHGAGALSSLMGAFEAARPGGRAEQAARHFDRALAASGAHPATVLVARAEALALPAGDRPAFEALLREALASGTEPDSPDDRVVKQRARWLLDTTDDRF